MARTKIICTLGPASSTRSVLRKMMREGMDVARLNFSHGTYDGHRALIAIIRELNRTYRRRIRILQDLEGFRIRVGLLGDHKVLALGPRQAVWLVQGDSARDAAGGRKTIPFDYEGPLRDIKVGHHIYIDDGTISLVVKGVGPARLEAEVVVGGILKEHKGVNIPEAHLQFSGLTQKDREDIAWGIEHRADYIAQSFVRTPDDVAQVRELVSGRAPQCRIIAKIENREGIRNIDGIIDVSDGIMVARGDMGVSVPIYEIPVIQKEIIKKCNQKKKFVITATQMLESMVEHARPTRAEVTDVANAILDGTDFVMLSAETAVGRHPVETVRMMDDIALFTERSRYYKKRTL